VIDVDLPAGAEGRLDLPVGPASAVHVDGVPARARSILGAGPHLVTVTEPSIVR
jgi:hypothetical protein